MRLFENLRYWTGVDNEIFVQQIHGFVAQTKKTPKEAIQLAERRLDNYKNIHKGSTFEDFLKAEGKLEEIDALAAKQLIALELKALMDKEHISKVELAMRMHTKRSTVYNLLDPNKDCKLTTVAKAAKVLGKQFQVKLV